MERCETKNGELERVEMGKSSDADRVSSNGKVTETA